ncbi:MAG: hypothetical protein GY801_31770 [bacterium]|nr:hypothetical protein [bacterium]
MPVVFLDRKGKIQDIMDTMLTVKNEHLQYLNAVQAVEFFRELLYAEATRIGVPLKNINISTWVDVPDGGIDASIHADTVSGQQSFVSIGLNCYQIKAGRNFSPWQPSEIKKEIFGKKSPARQHLGESVRHCLEHTGMYGLVCFGKDLTDEQQRKAKELLESSFNACDYREFQVEVWSLNNLISFLLPFPALALRVNGNHKGLFENHAMWASHADMESVFFAGEAHQHLIAQIQAALSSHTETPVHLHIWGEPGIGKTRLMLEATDTDALRSSVIYCKADSFTNSELMGLLQQGTSHVVLVLDECDPQSRKEIWNKLKCHSPRIRLVSLSDESVREAGLHSIKIPPLEEEQIKTILQGYGISNIRAGHWTRLCEGSPMVAHVIGQHVSMDSAEILTSLADIWERYIAGSDDRQSHAVEPHRRVMRYLSLFTRFGYGRPVDNEALIIWKMIHQADQSITWAIFQEVIHDLQTRNILQGTHTLHITPKLLHISLWIEWWNLYGERFPVDDVFHLPDSLRDWAFEMFEYASGSQTAARCVKELLGLQGVFQQHPQHLSTTSGARLFWVLTKVEPEAALRCLQNIPGTCRKEAFFHGHSSVIWALEEMAIRKDLFADAARLLLEAAETEGENRSSHASGVFVDLFYISLHPELSQTEASPQERFPLITEAFKSDSPIWRRLALQACERALRHDFVGTAIETERVVGEKLQLWKPETYGEIFDAYRQVWLYLSHNLEHLPENELREASQILLRTAHQVARIESLADMVIETIEQLAKKPYTDKERLLDDVMWILRREKLSDTTRKRWEQIKQDLTGTDFHSLLKRYVGMSVFEDNFDAEGKQTNLVQLKIEELAQQAITKPELLQAKLHWLMTTDAKKGYYFGYALGQRDVSFSLLPNFLQAQQKVKENECKAFLGGYLRALFEQDYPRWERFLESLTADAALNTWVPELTWRSGRLNDTSALRILTLVEAQIVDIRQLPVYAQGVQDLSEDVITQWIELSLAAPDDTTLAITLHLSHDYYLREPQHRLPEELTLRLLTHPILLQQPEKEKRDPSFAHIWELISKAFIQQYPHQRENMADFLFEHLGEEIPLFGGIFSSAQVILLEMIRQYPEEIWTRIAHSLEIPRSQQAYELETWLKGYDFPNPDMGSGAILPMFPMEPVWQWIDENIEDRAPYFASFILKELFRDEKNPCWMREFLVRYGGDKSLRKRLLESFYSYGWSGSQSLYLQSKRQEMLDFKQGEENAHVRRWIDEYVAELEYEIEQATIEEERRGF